jgi:hypothetical protein
MNSGGNSWIELIVFLHRQPIFTNVYFSFSLNVTAFTHPVSVPFCFSSRVLDVLVSRVRICECWFKIQ